MEKNVTPQLYSREGEDAVAQYGRYDKLLFISSIVISLTGVGVSVADALSQTLSDVVRIVVSVVGILAFVGMIFSTIKSAKCNAPAVAAVKQYVKKTFEENAEKFDLTKNVTEYTVTKDDDKHAYYLQQDGTENKITFDRTAVKDKLPLDVNMLLDVESYLKWRYVLRVDEGKAPLEVTLTDQTGKKPVTTYVVLNGALHKSVKTKTLRPEWEEKA